MEMYILMLVHLKTMDIYLIDVHMIRRMTHMIILYLMNFPQPIKEMHKTLHFGNQIILQRLVLIPHGVKVDQAGI